MRRKVISAVIAVLGICAAAADMMLLFVGAGASSRSVSSTGAPLGSGSSAGSSDSGASSGADSGDASGDGSDAADGAGSADADESSGGSTGDDTAASDGAFKDGTYTGAVVATGKGDVQVQVTVSGGKVTQVTAVKYPSDNPRSIGIAPAGDPATVRRGRQGTKRRHPDGLRRHRDLHRVHRIIAGCTRPGEVT